MAYEKRNNSGALFKNDRKEQPNHPDYKGDALIGGQEYWLSAWVKTGNKGKFMSLALTSKDDRPSASKPQESAQNPIGGGDLDDEIPFGPCKD